MNINQKWQRVKIADLGKVITGRTPPTQDIEYFGGKYLFITPSDMHTDKAVYTTERGLSEKGAKLLKSIYLPSNSVCVSCIGWQMGKTVIAAYPAFTNQQINSIIPHPTVNPDFLFYSLYTRRTELLSLGSAAGVRTPILNKSAFSALEVLLPPLSTQRKIADILSGYDRLIENNTRRIKILEEMAQLLYREWFVSFRFPGHEKVSTIESELGLIPQGWEVVKLDSIASVNELTVKTSNAPQDIHYVDIASVGTGIINNVEAVSFSEAPSRARRIVRHGDIIWSTVRPNRKSYSLILNPVHNLIVSTGFSVITAKKFSFIYLYQALTTDDFVNYLVNNATGSAYPAVNSGDFKNAIVLLPTKNLLDKFHIIVVDIFEQKYNLLTKNENLRKTRDLLLPKLISGEIDVEAVATSDLEALEQRLVA